MNHAEKHPFSDKWSTENPESTPITERSWEEPEQMAAPNSAPVSTPEKSGVRPVWRPESIEVHADMGASDRRGEAVAGDKTKPPFAPSVHEKGQDQSAAA
jgi:hypothetical protein